MCDDNSEKPYDYIKALHDEIAELKKKAAKFEAFDILRLRLALDKIDGAGQASKMASGVYVEIKNLDGQGITGQFGIVDGLSPETITALKKDIERTFLMRVDMNTPKALRHNAELLLRNGKG